MCLLQFSWVFTGTFIIWLLDVQHRLGQRTLSQHDDLVAHLVFSQSFFDVRGFVYVFWIFMILLSLILSRLSIVDRLLLLLFQHHLLGCIFYIVCVCVCVEEENGAKIRTNRFCMQKSFDAQTLFSYSGSDRHRWPTWYNFWWHSLHPVAGELLDIPWRIPSWSTASCVLHMRHININ